MKIALALCVSIPLLGLAWYELYVRIIPHLLHEARRKNYWIKPYFFLAVLGIIYGTIPLAFIRISSEGDSLWYACLMNCAAFFIIGFWKIRSAQLKADNVLHELLSKPR